MTENQSHTNEVILEQSHATEVRLGDERSGSRDQQANNNINSKMDKSQKEDNDDKDNEDDCKPRAQEKQQAKNVQDISDSDNDKQTKKKRRKQSFSLGCEVLHQHIEFYDGDPVYFDKLKLQREAQEAHERFIELDDQRREYQCTINAYEDLYQCYQEEHGLHQLYVYALTTWDELQVDSNKKSQLLYSIGEILRAESMTYPTPYPLSYGQELFFNKWGLRH